MTKSTGTGIAVLALFFLLACGESSDSSTDSASSGSSTDSASSESSTDSASSESSTGGSGSGLSLDVICPEFCAALLKCRQELGAEIDGDFIDSCETGCQEWNSASLTQSCMETHLETCDTDGFMACHGI